MFEVHSKRAQLSVTCAYNERTGENQMSRWCAVEPVFLCRTGHVCVLFKHAGGEPTGMLGMLQMPPLSPLPAFFLGVPNEV